MASLADSSILYPFAKQQKKIDLTRWIFLNIPRATALSSDPASSGPPPAADLS